MSMRFDTDAQAAVGPPPPAAQAEHDQLIEQARRALDELAYTEPAHQAVPAARAITNTLLALDLTLTEILRRTTDTTTTRETRP